jgi:hypothetical protein
MKKNWAILAYPKASPQREIVKKSKEEADWRSMWNRRAEEYWSQFEQDMRWVDTSVPDYDPDE